MISTKVVVCALALSISVLPAIAQDASSGGSSAGSSSAPAALPAGMPSDYSTGSTVQTGTYGQPLLPEGNPLSGLFTPQPQYPTSQTQMNQADPNIPSQYGQNPLNGLFTGQPQYPTSQTTPNPTNAPAGQTNNMLQGVFTGQNPFQTPQTPRNSEPQSKFAIPGFGQPKFEDMKKDGIPFKVDDPNAPKDPNDYPGRVPDPAPATAKSDKDKDKKADAKDKDSKDAKDKDKKADKDKDGKDKDKTADDKDAKDKDKDKTADGDDKDAKDKKDKDKEDAATKPSGPYNPLKDALVLLNAGQAQQAIVVLANFLKDHAGNAEAHYIAAVSYVNLRDFNMAAAEYRVVLHLVPSTPLAALAVEGLKKIGMPAIVNKENPAAKLPPLRTPAK